jgi:hypothetical protein
VPTKSSRWQMQRTPKSKLGRLQWSNFESNFSVS